MKIIYVSRPRLWTAALILFLCGLLPVGLWQQERSMVTADAAKPFYQGNTGKKLIGLTVNVDWGEEYIPTMLEEFKKNEAVATFFVTGKWAEKNPELLKKMAAAGHSIQNHGYKHCHFNQLDASGIQSEIKKAEDIIFKITGKPTCYFASPYGEFDNHLVKAVTDMDYRFIMWSVDTIDWQRPSPQTIHNRVLKRVHNDAIILMHPTDPTVKALPDMLQALKADGYTMVKIEDLIVDGGEPANERS